VWPEVNALADWSPGLAFAHANTKEEAIDQIVGERGKGWDRLRQELEGREPQIFDGPMGYTKIGSA